MYVIGNIYLEKCPILSTKVVCKSLAVVCISDQKKNYKLYFFNHIYLYDYNGNLFI
jgi:hypothetical protein